MIKCLWGLGFNRGFRGLGFVGFRVGALMARIGAQGYVMVFV